jgi:uncharacterized protein (DUF486 family)
MKQELEVDNILLQYSNVFVSFIFIELFNSSSGEDLTPFPSLMKLSKGIIQFNVFLLSKPSTPMGYLVYCFLLMCDGVARTNLE